MRILIFKATGGFQYDVVNRFAEELGAGVKKYDCESVVIDINQSKQDLYKAVINELAKGIDFVVHFNGFLVDSINGVNTIYEVLNVLNIPVAAILVDHPFYHIQRIKKLMKNKNVFICMYSDSFLYSFENYIGNDVPIAQLMHGGSFFENSDKEKIYDVLIAGTINDPIDFYKEILVVEDRFLRNIFIDIYEAACNDYSIPLDIYFDEILKKNGIELYQVRDNLSYNNMIIYAFTIIDKCLRQKVRYRTLKVLAKEGFSIELFGKCKVDELRKFKNINIHGPITYSQLLEEMSKSKIVVHDLNVCINGSHERVFSAMLNKTLVISNINYFDVNELKEGQHIIYYDVNNPTDLVKKIKFYLKNTTERENIVDSAYKIAKDKYTWKNRAKELIQVYNEFNKLLHLE